MIIYSIHGQYQKGLCYYKAGKMRWILFGPWLQIRLYDTLALRRLAAKTIETKVILCDNIKLLMCFFLQTSLRCT